MELENERMTFEGATGAELNARLDCPSGEIRGYALFAHCFTCSKDVFASSRISKALARQGLATLRFDFTGIGHSDGEFAHTNFSSNVEDLVAAADFLRDYDRAPSLLVGHSLGGAAALMAAGEIDELEAVATVNAPCHPEHVRHLFGDSIEEIEEAGEAEVTLAGRTFRIQKHFLDDLADQNMQERIGALNKPLMIFHGPRDNTVGIENAARIFEAAKHPKSFVSLDDADHLLTRPSDATYVGLVLSAWGSRYLDDEELTLDDDPSRPEIEDLAPETVYVGESGTGKFTNDVLVGDHHLKADEPPSVGGDDAGPTPYDYLSAGLGACKSMTMRMYAERKGWDVDKIQVRVDHDKIHADDCETCETEDKKVDHLRCRIRLDGDLSDEQRDRIVEIAGKCPVHQTLERDNKIETELEEQ